MDKPFLYFDQSYINDISNKIDYINPKENNHAGAVQTNFLMGDNNTPSIKDFVKIATNLYKITKN